jgi:hypothetical protein
MYTFGEIWLYVAKGSVLFIMFVFALIQWYWCQEAEEESREHASSYLEL